MSSYAEARVIDIQHAKIFATSIGGLIAALTVANWTTVLLRRHATSRPSTLGSIYSCLSKPIALMSKACFIGTWIFVPGRVLLITSYFSLNLSLMFTNLDLSNQSYFAMRCGWLTLCNLCLVIFLGLKNTPISPLAGRSYEQLNVLHRACGYTTILLMLLHSTNYIASLYIAGLQMYLMQPGQYAGAAAAVSFLLIGISGVRFLRQRQYELFFMLHVILVTVILITTLLHVKQINLTAMIFVIVAGGMWFVDRSLRLSRWIYHGYGNSCTLIPLPEGATKVIMRCSIKAQAGSHAFLWIPQVRAFQTHPFSLVSNDPAQFIISAQNGFTKELHDLALQHPHKQFRAAIEGPYGNAPFVGSYDKVVLISGGSGICFTLALAMDWLKRQGENGNSRKTLDFVWTVRSKDYLDWFETELKELHYSPLVNLKIHITSTSKASKAADSTSSLGQDSDREERTLYDSPNLSKECGKDTLRDVIEFGRPDPKAITDKAVVGLSKNDRVLVAASGPSSLLDSIRMSASSSKDGPMISTHIETFGW